MFRFAHPELLYLLIVIPLLIVFYVVMIRRKKKAIAEFGNPELLGPLMPLLSFKRGTWKFVMLMLALLFVIVGVAGPQFGSKLQQVKKKGVELKIGLIVFAGDAYVQLPITTDYSSAKLFLSNISTDIVPVQGTAIGSAIDLAARSFTPETETSKAIIVITDGENHQDDAVAAAKQAHEKGIVIHTIGMGLEQGAPIPEKGKPGQFMQDAQGNVVISKLDEQTLQDIAKAGEGLYIRASNTEVGLNRLLDEVNRMEKSLLEERVYSDYAEKYQYFLLVGLFFIFVEFMILGRKNKHFMKINLFKR